MLARLIFSIVILAMVPSLAPTMVTAQTVRFRTNVGEFDMLLNPTGNDNLQPLVDNMLSYVESKRYANAVINRAVDSDNDDASDDFVLQMGGFLTSRANGVTADDLQSTPVRSFDTVTVDANGDGNIDFDTTGLSNIRGTVSLALAGGDPNSGNSSFFVNLGGNEFLDDQGFVPFAYIQDMTTIDRIMALDQISLDSSLTFTDVPLNQFDDLVIINSVEVIGAGSTLVGPLGPAAATSISQELFTQSASSSSSASASSANASASSLTSSTASVPEPSSLLLILAGSMVAASRRRNS